MNSRSRKFLAYYRPYWRLLLVDLACAFVVAAVALALPLLVRYITRDLLEGGAGNTLEQIYLVGAIMVALVAVHTACNLFVDYRGHLMGAQMESTMRLELFDHFQKLSFAFYDEQKVGQLMTRMTTDIFWLTELFHHGPEDIAISLLKFIGAFAILITIDVELTVITFLFLPVMAAYAWYFNRRMNAALSRSKARIGDINAQVEDTLAGIRVVKSFTNEAIEKRKFARENARFLASRGEGYRSEAYFSGGLIAFSQLITVAVAVFGAVGIVRAHLDLADLLTYILCIGILIDPIERFGNFARLYQEGITGFNRYMEIMEVTPDIVECPHAVELTHVHGHLAFQNVSFQYRQSRDYVLRHVDLEIQPGEYIALVGTSGVGKTTLCSLIPRFYDVSAGRILLDGIDIRDVRLSSLRQSIGIVQQDVYLFAGTVAENISYGKPGAGPEEIVAAARKANAHDFIMALPDGYDTDIGQRGVKLSGGQKQRLSIARVFLKDPPIVIFDEATSALDNESEKAVRDSLEKLTDNRTTLVIAHRLSTIRNARRIVVLTDNGIAEQGTHDALIAAGGAYARLYAMQLTL